jgi:membrane-bound metal-dependent hydrolase YbcI (DUF457 family)
MDILTHTVMGLAVGSVVTNMIQYRPVYHKMTVVLFGALGGFFPDIDAISLWSGFDGSFGKWFTHSGKEIYFGKWWYSHHGFFHSIFALLLGGLIAGFPVYALLRILRRGYNLHRFQDSYRPVFFTFVFAGFTHLLCDCVTPASTWGGVRMFWPLPVYVGGWGDVWWWHNYDIFLIAASCFLLNISWLIFCTWMKMGAGTFPVLFALAAIIFIAVELHNRETNYSYKGITANYQQLEEASKKEQQRILGKTLYRRMDKFSRWLPFYF